MKKILGLDLGSASIGWAVVEENSNEIVNESESAADAPKDRILAIGSRIIPLSVDECTQFSKGQALTKNADRTQKRTQRKGYDRRQLRRALLLEKLAALGMYDGRTLKLSTLDLWGLRAKAVTERVSLPELGRVLCHINRKRGYRTVKSDYEDKKQGEYVKHVVERYREIHGLGLTVGQYIYGRLQADPAFRYKDRIYPRDAYVEEYDAVMECQRRFYPEVLTDEVVGHIRNYIIFHQRPLKSCKHLVGRCELERRDAETNGRTVNCGPRVAPRSSPLFQVCRIWECINNLRITDKCNDVLQITMEQKRAIFDFMNTHGKMTATNLKALLGIKSRDWQFGRAVGSGLQGNTTRVAISDALGDIAGGQELLRFDLHTADGTVVDTETGEVSKVIDASFEREPLYMLWHVLYSISDMKELRGTLERKFGITDEETLDRLCRIDFVKSGYSNKSSRAMRKILPYLQEGMQYYEAKLMAGYDDTLLNREQNEARELAERLKPIQKGELRQPVVEKVLNQLVNLVNALMSEYGRFDEIRVELARELKQSREEREAATRAIGQNNRRNEVAAAAVMNDCGFTPTRSRIQKYRLWNETDHQCIYCGKIVNEKEFLLGTGVEVEHIIPRSVLFDDSFSNKTCACRKCNAEKGNRTAYDYMKSKPEGEFNAYIERVNALAEKYNPKSTADTGISGTKKNKLLMSAADLPDDFIERQLRESQYIAKKAKEMLLTVCRNVWSTSGSVTDFLRHIWGWDDVLHSLNIDNYRAAGLTKLVEREVNGRTVCVERIADWNKRLDHRHHAVDALTIACTRQGYIQRLNNLNSLKEVSFRNFSDKEQDEDTLQRLTRLERYIRMQPHFPTAEVARAVSGIAVSFKSGKRVAGSGKRYIRKGGKRICVQRGIIIPRGALSEESVYGRINDSKTGKEEIVIKYKVADLKPKDVEFVVDKRIREILQQRLNEYGGDPKKAFAEPVLDHQGREIRSVRCRTGVNTAVPLRFDESGKPISFVKPGNNHHVAIYEDENGRLHEHVVTFWHAVERKKYGLPIVITDPGEVWERVTEDMPESFLRQLPPSATWRFRLSMQQNEMFVLGMDDESYRAAMAERDYAALSRYLYRVQKLSEHSYMFRKHYETRSEDKYPDENGKMIINTIKSRNRGAMQRIASVAAFRKMRPHKVHVDITGKILEI